MNRIVKVASFLLAVFMAAGTAVAQTPAQAAAGQKVYAAQKCGICHSVGNTGHKKGPLDTVGAKLSAADIRLWITDAPGMATKAKADRKPPMKAYPGLSKADLDSLVAYLQTLK